MITVFDLMELMVKWKNQIRRPTIMMQDKKKVHKRLRKWKAPNSLGRIPGSLSQRK